MLLKDYKKAFDWYSRAAQAGNVDAQFTLGIMYYLGEGTSEDIEMAKIWLKKAADHGHKDAIALFEEVN